MDEGDIDVHKDSDTGRVWHKITSEEIKRAADIYRSLEAAEEIDTLTNISDPLVQTYFSSDGKTRAEDHQHGFNNEINSDGGKPSPRVLSAINRTLIYANVYTLNPDLGNEYLHAVAQRKEKMISKDEFRKKEGEVVSFLNQAHESGFAPSNQQKLYEQALEIAEIPSIIMRSFELNRIVTSLLSE